MKNSPSLFSTLDFPPFLDADQGDEDDDDDDEAVEVDGMFLDSIGTSDSSHKWASTWHIPSSTSGLRWR